MSDKRIAVIGGGAAGMMAAISALSAGADVNYAILDTNVKIGAGVVLGGDKATAPDVTVIGNGTVIADGEKIEAGSMIPDVR